MEIWEPEPPGADTQPRINWRLRSQTKDGSLHFHHCSMNKTKHSVSQKGKMVLFGDLRRRVLVEREHNSHPLPKVYVQQFLHENGAQLCSYLVCRFVHRQ